MSERKPETTETPYLIITEMGQILSLDLSREHFHGVELRVSGGPDDGCIYLTPMLLSALSVACAKAAKDLDALGRVQYTRLNDLPKELLP